MKQTQAVGRVALYASLACISLITLFPLAWMLSGSLKTEATIFNFPIQFIPDVAHWDNYLKAWSMVNFGALFRNSLKISSLVTVGQLFTSTLAAYGFAKIRFRGRDKLFLGYLATMMVPFQVIMIPQFVMFRNLGLANTHLALILPGMFSVFGVFLLKQFFAGIPDELLEAARIDGCGEARTLFTIVVPLSKAAISSLAIFTFKWTWNDFLAPLIYINDKPKMTVPIGLSMFRMENITMYTYIMAGSVISLIPVIVVYIFTQKYLVQGIALTGLKA